ncbi:hypothetical protein HAX54_029016, partial [Datura stramonium]|nr:hypothetical protein [Datura stramonium]
VNRVESIECVSVLDAKSACIKRGKAFEKLDRPSAWEKPKTSIKKALVLDLKHLPYHLR